MKATAIATVSCLIAATLEVLLAGGSVRVRLSELRMPAYSPGFRVWMLIGVLYYVMCFLVLRRLLSAGTLSNSHPWALMLVIAVLAANASWNALFFTIARSLGELSRVYPLWTARPRVSSHDGSNLRIRSHVADCVLRLSHLRSVVELSIVAA